MRHVIGRSGFVDGLARDLRLAARGLRRTPGLAAAATLTLGLGLGANTVIFSLVNALFGRPLPVAEPQRLVSIYTSDYSGSPWGATSYPDYADFREHQTAFDGLVAFTPTPVSLDLGAGGERALAELVSADAFDVLGLRPAAGRGLRAEDDLAPDVAVVSHALWQGRFGSDPGLIGRTLRLNGRPVTVVGVAPAGFRGLLRGLDVGVWLPLHAQELARPGSDGLSARGNRSLMLLGRLRPGVTPAQAQAQLDALAARQFERHREAWADLHGAGRRLTLLPESESRVFPAARGPLAAFLGLLLASVGLVLLVACTNLAGLLLARASSRRREIGVRLALGASRARLVRQLLAESVLLALPGGALGVVLAAWGTRALSALQPPLPVPVHLDLGLDWRVVGFAFGLTLACGVLFGLAPALQSTRADLLPALHDGTGATAGARGLRLRRVLVTAQVAVSLLLLGGAGLFLRSLANAHAIDLGFEPDGVLLASLDTALGGFGPDAARAAYEGALERVAALPGVEAVSLTTSVPLGLSGGRRGVWVEGYAAQPGEDLEVASAAVGPDYFATLRLPLVRGRGFTRADRAGGPGVAVVNETFARRYWPGQDPLGKRLSTSGDQGPFLEVVGLARDAKYVTLGEDPRPFFYTALLQEGAGEATLLVRTSGPPAASAGAVRAALLALDARLPVFDLRSLTASLGLALLPARLASLVLGSVGVFALALSALGLYGLVAWSAARRTREIGLRLALGASPRDVRRLLLRQGLSLAAVGLVLGLAATLGLGQLLRGFLYGIGPTDVPALLGATLLLGTTALAASLVPARRAMRVDPAAALRAE